MDDAAQFNFVIPTESSGSSRELPNASRAPLKGNWKQRRMAHKRIRYENAPKPVVKPAPVVVAPVVVAKVAAPVAKVVAPKVVAPVVKVAAPVVSKPLQESRPIVKPFVPIAKPQQSAPTAPLAPKVKKPFVYAKVSDVAPVKKVFTVQPKPATEDTPEYVSSSIFTSNPEQVQKSALPPKAAPLAVRPASNVFSAINTFQEMDLNPLLVKHLSTKLLIKKPTKIQRVALPILLDTTHQRDALIKAQTGSGKTLTFLLPLIHRILNAPQEMDIDSQINNLNRSIGCLGIILAPTRELARQIYTNLESVLQYSNAGIRNTARDGKTSDDEGEEEVVATGPIFKSHWIVPGIVVGGEKKKSEKARLRKGINILVSTPGRLLDHLKTTQCFEAGNLRWLVLDEADRLLELGFEETLTEIISILDSKRRQASVSVDAIRRLRVTCWPRERQTILCSATLSDEVKKLAATSLVDPMMINQDDLDFKKAKQTLKDLPEFKSVAVEAETEKIVVPIKAVEEKVEVAKKTVDKVVQEDDEETKVSEAPLPFVEKKAAPKIKALDIPTQIQQNYVIAPAKQRLMILVSMLRHLATVWKNKQDKTPCKIMVFISSCDSVDFYHRLLNEGATKSASEATDEHPRGMNLEGMDVIDPLDSDFDLSGSDDEEKESKKDMVKFDDDKKEKIKPRPVVPHLPVYKLHGNLDMKTRSTTTREFSASNNSILLCTDVASRGLDVPNITHVIQFDPPTDLSDYAHRVGRTARIGKQGEATIFLLPSEVELLSVLETRNVSGLTQLSAEKILGYFSSDIETVEEDGYQGGLDGIIEFNKQVVIKGKRIAKKKHYEIVATDVHMMMERYVLGNKEMNALARSAFTAHVRSYSTHSPSHNEFLHVKRLHLGHMAKAFALREAPNSVASANSSVIGKKRREVEEEGKKAGWGSFKRKSDMLVGAGANEFSDGGVKKLGKFRPKNSHGSGVNGNLVREGKRFEYSLKKRARN